MKLAHLREARYHKHPVLTWIKEKISKNRPLSDALILSDREYEELRKILPQDLGEPQRRQDGMHWVLKDKTRRFYLDLQELFGPPKDRSKRLTISSIDPPD